MADNLQRVDGWKLGFKLPIWYPKDVKKIFLRQWIAIIKPKYTGLYVEKHFYKILYTLNVCVFMINWTFNFMWIIFRWLGKYAWYRAYFKNWTLDRHLKPVFAGRGRKRPPPKMLRAHWSSSFNQPMAVERGRSHVLVWISEYFILNFRMI